MGMSFEVRDSEQATFVEASIDEHTALIFHRRAGAEGVVLKLRPDDDPAEWLVPVSWTEAVGGQRVKKAAVFEPLCEMYRFLRRTGLTERSLHYLVRGPHAERNEGYAVGSATLASACVEATALIARASRAHRLH